MVVLIAPVSSEDVDVSISEETVDTIDGGWGIVTDEYSRVLEWLAEMLSVAIVGWTLAASVDKRIVTDV